MSGGEWFVDNFIEQGRVGGEIGQEPQPLPVYDTQPAFNVQQPHQNQNYPQTQYHPAAKKKRPIRGQRRARPPPRPVQYSPTASQEGFYNEIPKPQSSYSHPPQHHLPQQQYPQGYIGNQVLSNQFFGDFNSQHLTQMGMAAASTIMKGMQDPSQIAGQLSNNIASTLRTNSMLSLGYYKRWFQVDNSYVFTKFRLILLPLYHDHWGRQFDPDRGYEAPVADVNCPDGYLPMMLYVTYVMLMGYMGATEQSDFSPQVFIKAASTGLGMIIFESLMVFKVGFWLTKIVTVQPHYVDLLCYSGYKFLAVNSSLTMYLISASTTVYYVAAIALGLLFGMFIAKSFKPYYGNAIQAKFMSPSAQGGIFSVMNIFLLIITALQVPIILYLGRSIL